MAVVNYTLLKIPNQGSSWAVQWVLTGSDTGAPLHAPHLPDKTVDIYGTFGAGNIQIEGALHFPTPDFKVVKDANGNVLSAITAGKIEAVQPNLTAIRPVATSVTSITIVVLASAARPTGGV